MGDAVFLMPDAIDCALGDDFISAESGACSPHAAGGTFYQNQVQLLGPHLDTPLWLFSLMLLNRAMLEKIPVSLIHNGHRISLWYPAIWYPAIHQQLGRPAHIACGLLSLIATAADCSLRPAPGDACWQLWRSCTSARCIFIIPSH